MVLVRPVVTLVLSLCLSLALAAHLAPAHARGSAGEVHGDDAGDRFVGTGGLILPASVHEVVRREVASCLGCHWMLTTPCANTDLGRPVDDGCRGVVRGCPGGQLRRSWFQPAGDGWRDVGLICMQQGRPWTVRDAGRAAADQVAERVPALRPVAQPSVGVLPHLPTYFRSGTSGGTHVFSWMASGHRLEVHAEPTWSWSFGDGGRLESSDPGGEFPDGGVAHAYRTAGRYDVEVTATWRAVFWSEGLGPFPVPEPVHQEARIPVTVGEGRATLVAPRRPPT